MRYQQECEDNAAIIARIRAHVIAELSAQAAADDDPETNADDVRVFVTTHPDKAKTVIVVGFLDAEPQAHYLAPDFDGFAGIDPDLMKAAGLDG